MQKSLTRLFSQSISLVRSLFNQFLFRIRKLQYTPTILNIFQSCNLRKTYIALTLFEKRCYPPSIYAKEPSKRKLLSLRNDLDVSISFPFFPSQPHSERSSHFISHSDPGNNRQSLPTFRIYPRVFKYLRSRGRHLLQPTPVGCQRKRCSFVHLVAQRAFAVEIRYGIFLP